MYTTLHPSPVGDILLRADDEGRLTELYLRHDGADGHRRPVRRGPRAARRLLRGRARGLRPAARAARHRLPAARLGRARADPVRRDDLLLGARPPAGRPEARPGGRARERPQPDLDRHPLPPRHRGRRLTGGLRRRARAEAAGCSTTRPSPRAGGCPSASRRLPGGVEHAGPLHRRELAHDRSRERVRARRSGGGG